MDGCDGLPAVEKRDAIIAQLIRDGIIIVIPHDGVGGNARRQGRNELPQGGKGGVGVALVLDEVAGQQQQIGRVGIEPLHNP